MDDGAAAALVIVFMLVGLGLLALWIWALVDAVKVPDDTMFRSGNKLVWILVIVLAGGIGAIVYLLVGRPAPGARPAGAQPVGPPPPPPPPGAIV
jgi:uncharacterized membrane protein